MLSERLKQDLVYRDLPTEEQLLKMAPMEIIRWAHEMDEIAQSNFAKRNEHLTDVFFLKKGICRVCESKSDLRPKETKYAFTYFCNDHYPTEAVKLKKQRTFSDVFSDI